MSLTIIRTGLAQPLEQIVGLDVAEEVARDLVDTGTATWGPDYEIPPALCLLLDLEIRGFTYPAGTLLTVGREIVDAEALLLMRGDMVTAGGGVVSVPAGGVG